MKKIHIYIAIMFMICLSACSDANHDELPFTGNGDMAVAASMKGLPNGLADEGVSNGSGSIAVKSGNYTFLLSHNKRFSCVFAEGFGHLYSEAGGAPLQWDILNDVSNTKYGPVFLDNVKISPNEEICEDKNKHVTFSGPIWDDDERNNYKACKDAGKGDQLVGSDIVWGDTVITKKDVVRFDLTHRMSRTDVVLTQLDDDFKNENITVELTDLELAPAAFNRLTGEVLLKSPKEGAPEPLYNETLTLVKNDALSIEEDEGGKKIGRTPSFILPPQNAHDTDRKCYLRVTIDGKTFAAPLPDLMVHYPSNVSDMTSFTPGCHVEIRAHIANDAENPKIEFGPVYVKDWDDVGDYTVPAPAGGVTDLESLDELIRLYNSLPEFSDGQELKSGAFEDYLMKNGYWDNFRKLTRYGTYAFTGGKVYWTFKLKGNVSGLSSGALKEQFKYIHYYGGSYPFTIDFDDYKMTIDGVEHTEFDDVVKEVLIKEMPTPEDIFLEMVNHYNSLIDLRTIGAGDLTQISDATVYNYLEANDAHAKALVYSYGSGIWWNQKQGKLQWTLKMPGNVNLDKLGNGFKGFSKDFYDNLYPFMFNFQGYTLTVGGKTYTDNEPELLDKLFSN